MKYSNDTAKKSEADVIRDLLAQAKLGQRAAARELGIDERTMRYWCSGQTTPPPIAMLALERVVERQRWVTDDGVKTPSGVLDVNSVLTIFHQTKNFIRTVHPHYASKGTLYQRLESELLDEIEKIEANI